MNTKEGKGWIGGIGTDVLSILLCNSSEKYRMGLRSPEDRGWVSLYQALTISHCVWSCDFITLSTQKVPVRGRILPCPFSPWEHVIFREPLKLPPWPWDLLRDRHPRLCLGTLHVPFFCFPGDSKVQTENKVRRYALKWRWWWGELVGSGWEGPQCDVGYWICISSSLHFLGNDTCVSLDSASVNFN